MDIRIWNKETKQAFVGTLLYSLLGVLASLIKPIVSVGKMARSLSDMTGETYSGGTGASVFMTILELGIIAGYVIFFLAIKDLRNNTEGEEQRGFKRIYQSIIFDVIAAVSGIFHLKILGGIFALVACFLLISAYSTLKSSRVISDMSTSAASGFSLLFASEILILIGILIGWIPIIRIIGGILQAIAWLLVLFGWRKVARPVAVPGGAPEAEKPVFETMKEVLTDSVAEAKVVAKEVADKAKIVVGEVGTKAKEASENIKDKFAETNSEPKEDNPGE